MAESREWTKQDLVQVVDALLEGGTGGKFSSLVSSVLASQKVWITTAAPLTLWHVSAFQTLHPRSSQRR